MKMFINLFIIGLTSFIASQKIIVKAAYDEAYCKETVFKLADLNDINYWDYLIEKDSVKPNFILDYFQDPDKNGISLNLTITSKDLIATYWKWETHDDCLPYETYQSGMASCKYDGPREPGYYYSYWTPQRKCVQQPPETTYRPIENGTISVWLEPTESTRELLGPGPYYQGTNKPVLRYLYPDQWALVVVHPGERKIIEKPWFRNSEDVEKFLKENKDFILLDTSAKSYDISSRFPESESPNNGKITLALFGWGNRCHADLPGVPGFDGHEVCSFSQSEYTTGYGLKSITIKFDRIPLDVPGEWHIGVSFYQFPAKYDQGRSEEAWNNGLSHEFNFSDENMEKQFSFESYIIRSAPCNPEEPNNCWEEEKPAG
jgi:hypothetical protein